MGIVQKDAFRITILSYLGMFLGYFNKTFLFIIFLTTEEIGLLNLLLSIGVLFAQFCNLGSVYTVGKFFPFFHNRSKNSYGFLAYNLLIVTVGVVVFTTLSLIFKPQISAHYDKSPEFVTYYNWFIPIGIAYVYFLLFDNYLRALFKNVISVFLFDVFLRILTAVVLLAYGFQWISFDLLLKISSLIYVIPTLILFAYLIYLKEINAKSWRITIPKRFRKVLFRFSSLSYFNTLGSVIITTIDAMMVAAYLGMAETGIYTTVVFLASFLQVPYRTLIRITTPLVATYWKTKNMVKMQELYQQVSSVLLIVSTILFMYVWINREAIFYILKPEFVAGIPVFLFIMIGRLTDMYLGLNGTIFTMSKKYAFDLIFTFLLIGIVYVLNVVFIPKMGMSGAAISTMIALLVYNIGRSLFVWVHFKLHPFAKKQLLVLLLFALNIVAFELLPHLPNRIMDIVVRSSIFTLTFPLLILVFKVEKEINTYLGKLWSKYVKKIR